MKVKLSADWAGNLDGINTVALKAGEIHDLPEHIAKVLIHDGRATNPDGSIDLEPQGGKMEFAPQNKMERPIIENKSPRKYLRKK